jgi:hypothetical protein
VVLSPVPRLALYCGLASTLILMSVPRALHAEPSLSELAAEIQALKAENRQIKDEMAQMRGETRRAREKVRDIAQHQQAYTLPASAPVPVPAGATPVFVTIDKRLQLGALTITPGGFVAMETAYRTRTEQSDIGSQYQGIPFGPQAGTSELRFTARQSRVALLVEAPISAGLGVSGYGEFDFLGSGYTSNSNESNSYVLRVRQLYTTLDSSESGLHFLAGQTFSLLTTDGTGIKPRSEDIPLTIDAQYVPGFVWKRQPQMRVTKDYGNGFWLAGSAELPETTYTGCTAGVNGTTIPTNSGAGNLVTCDLFGTNNLNGSPQSFSLNHVPDLVGKVAYDTHFGDHAVHLEGKAIYRDMYDRVANPTHIYATNMDTAGWGVGGGIIAQIVPKRLDFEVTTLIGRGIGSYGTAQFTDSTFGPNGAPSPLREEMFLGGLTYHATSMIDFYAYAGLEQVQTDYYTTNALGTAFAGYGAPTANNSGCFNYITGSTATCAGNAKRIWQVTGGLWDKVYKGDFGEVRLGLQYSYTQRELFAGNGTTAPAPPYPNAPKQDDHSIFTSVRYYPFQ